MDYNYLFVKKYRMLENMVREKYGTGLPNEYKKHPVKYLEGLPEYFNSKNDLYNFRHVRNMLSHEDVKNESDPFDVKKWYYDKLCSFIDIFYPSKLKDIMIKREDVFACSLDDNLLDAVKIMQKNNYTHIPILDNEIVKGVFSEGTVLSDIIDEEITEITKETKFRAYEKYLPIKSHRSESFRFCGPEMMKSELEEKFAEARDAQDRIGMVFVTEDGKSTGKLLGLVTVWDLA